MSLLAKIAVAALSSINPMIGLFLDTLMSAGKGDVAGWVLNLVTLPLPGGFIKDVGLSVALELAATESGATQAARIIAPDGSLTVKCQDCGSLTTRYVGVNGSILCTSCAGGTIHRLSIGADRLLVYKSNISVYHGTIRDLNHDLGAQRLEINVTTKVSKQIANTKVVRSVNTDLDS